MLKLKMVHKGLILVAVPLVFGTLFIWLLSTKLAELDRMVQRELLMRDLIISHMIALRCAVAANKATAGYVICKDPMYIGLVNANKQQATAIDMHIKELLKNEPYLLDAAKQASSQQIVNSTRSGFVTTSLVLRRLALENDIQTKAAIGAMNSLRSTLYGGMVAGAVISVLLAVFFCLRITNRIVKILFHTVSLLKGTELSRPLKGHDEISELDQFLFQAGTEIRELERFKKEMIGVVSRELKSPLSSLGSFLSSLSAGAYGALAPKAQDKAVRTHKSVERLMGLVAELLHLDRLELDMEKEEIDVDELIAASVGTVKELSEQSGIEIAVKTQDGTIFADRDRLVQVIVNLLSNAMKFSPPQGQVTIETRRSDGWFECRVTDQGRGIPEEFRKQIFEPFKQVDATDATAKKGTGLGLTISRSIVEQHGGIIGVDSEEGKGSTFWFKLPASESASKSSGQPRPIPVLTQPESGETWRLQLISQMRGSRTFSVLQQGLVIISVPLIFQMGFGFWIAHLLNQVSQQIQREEQSIELLGLLNRGAEQLFASTVDGVWYVITRESKYWDDFLKGKDRLFGLLDQAERFCAADPEEMSDLKELRECLVRYAAAADKEAVRKVDKDDDLHDSSVAAMMQRAIFFQTDPNLSKEVYPVFQAQKAQERLMKRERAIGEKLSAQRVHMFKGLEETLFEGVVLNLLMSVVLAVLLMRNLSSRLQHVMANTARLVKRKALDPPLAGGDEIAYLDRILYEIGNQLLQLEKFKQDLIAIVSHELRTPLMSISTALELFEVGALGELSEEGKNQLGNASNDTHRLIRLITNLLDIEKMDAGEFILDCSEFKVSDLVQSSIASVGPLAETKEIKLESFVTDPEMSIYADRDRLLQVLIRLLSDAIKSSPENDSIRVSVEHAKDNQLRFCVIDHGREIPEAMRQKIFERFVQVEESLAKERGSDLGLAISRAIVERHGGTVGVDSDEHGVGTTFWFQLPASKDRKVVRI